MLVGQPSLLFIFLESGYCLSLDDIIFVSSITWNQLFVSKLANVGYTFMTGYNDVTISFNSHIVGYGYLEGDLYML